ncbi:NUDIX hydrolase [Arthrobacter tecti]
MTIDRDTYEEPDSTISDWDIIAGRDSAASLAFTPGGTHVVLFEQFRVGPAQTLLELPGGYLVEDEDPVPAARRELLEETGYEAAGTYYAGSEWWAANSRRRKHLVIAADARPTSDPAWDASEMGEIRLLPSDELIPFLISGNLTDAGLACRGLMSLASRGQAGSSMKRLQQKVRDLLSAAYS